MARVFKLGQGKGKDGSPESPPCFPVVIRREATWLHGSSHRQNGGLVSLAYGRMHHSCSRLRGITYGLNPGVGIFGIPYRLNNRTTVELPGLPVTTNVDDSTWPGQYVVSSHQESHGEHGPQVISTTDARTPRPSDPSSDKHHGCENTVTERPCSGG